MTTDSAPTTTDQPLVQQSVITYVIRAASAGLNYLLQLVLVFYIGDFEYGIYALAWTYVIMFGHFSCFGFNTTIIRFIPTYLVKDDHEHARGFLFVSRLAVLGFSTLMAILLFAGIHLFQDKIPEYYVTALSLAAVCIPLFALMDLHEDIARTQSWIVLAFAPTYIARPLLVMLFTIAALQAGASATAITVIIASLVTLIIVGIFQISKIMSKFRKVIRACKRKYETGLWFKTSVPLLITDGSELLMTNADILVLSLFVTPEQIGVYFVLTRSLALAKFIRFAIATVSGRGFAEYSAHEKLESLGRMTRQTTIWSFVLTLAATGIILLIGIPLLSLFGERFVDAYPVMFWLAVGVVISGATGALDQLLMVLGYQNKIAMLQFITLAVNLTLNFALIPVLGMYGAAIATSAALTLQAIGLCWICICKAGINPIFESKKHQH